MLDIWLECGWAGRVEGTNCSGIVAAIMNGHVTAFTVIKFIRKQLAHKVFQSEAALLEDACFAVLGEYYVVGG